jgi:hypothetical protein
VATTREDKLAFIQSKLAAAQTGSAPGTAAPQGSGAPVRAKTTEEKLAFIKTRAADPSVGPTGLLDALAQVAKTVDSYTTAPVRAAIGAMQDGKNPFPAYGHQFGEDPDNGPSGKQLAQKAGVSDRPLIDASDDEIRFASGMSPIAGLAAKAMKNISRSGAAGFGIDVAADPTNLLPLVPFAKAGKGLKAVVGVTGEAAGVVGKAAGRGAMAVPGAQTIATAADVAREGAVNTASALKKLFTPSQAHDFPELLKIAQKHGIDPSLLPEAVEFGEGSFISRASRNRAEGVLGEQHLKRFEQGLEAVQDATERHVAKIGGGSVPNSVEAGEIIRKGFDDGVDRLFDKVGMTHNKVVEAIPGLTLSPEAAQKIGSKLNGIERWAKGRAVRGFTATQRTQAEQVLKAIEAVREGNGTYKQTLETLRDIGEIAFKSQNSLADIPPDIAKFRDLYGTINDGLIDTVRQAAGGPVADELLESNKMIHEFLGDKSLVSGVIGNKNMAPERVFQALVEHGDTAKIEALKRILPPESFQRLKGSFLAAQIKRTADGGFTFKSLQNNLRSKKNVLGAILEPNEIDEIASLIRLGDRFGQPVLSTSGTGASGLFSDLAKGIRSGVESDTVIGLLKDSARNRSAQKTVEETSRPLLKTAGTEALKAVGEEALSNTPKTMKSLLYSGQAAQTSGRAGAGQYRRDQQAKGKDKWADEGFGKILEHEEAKKKGKKNGK